MQTNEKIAFIGSVGVPNKYGGFESFLESVAPILKKHVGGIIVTCDSNKYDNKDKFWNGIERIFIPLKANGYQSILHDFFAYLKVCKSCKHIFILGVSSGILFPFIRLLSILFRNKIYVNVDGIEWRRDKYNKFTRIYLRISDYLAQYFSDIVIIDSLGLIDYVIKPKRQSFYHVGYSGDQVKVYGKNFVYQSYFLTICRIEPENNCHILLRAFEKLNMGKYFFVGNWGASSYGRKLKSEFSGNENIILLDPIYDQKILSQLRSNCKCYIHGHSVGGTNPSLVEMLYYDVNVVAYDCIFNKYTAGDTIYYFADQDDLIDKMKLAYENQYYLDRTHVRKIYTREAISSNYLNIININTNL